MCNLSQGIWREGYERGVMSGMEKGKTIGVKKQATSVITAMLQNGFAPDVILKNCPGISLEDIADVAKTLEQPNN